MWLGRFSTQKQEFAPSGAFQVGKLLSNSMPLYGLAMVCTPQLKKYTLLGALLLPIPKQTPFQEHRQIDRCQAVVQHSSFQQAVTQTQQKTKESQSVPGWLCGWLWPSQGRRVLTAALWGSAVLTLHSVGRPPSSGGSWEAGRPLTPQLAAWQNKKQFKPLCRIQDPVHIHSPPQDSTALYQNRALSVNKDAAFNHNPHRSSCDNS